MKIIGLQIKNLRKIVASEMRISEKGLTIVKGKNEQGKSTVCKALEAAFRGASAVPDDFLSHGSTEGGTVIELKDDDRTLKVERVYRKEKGDVLRITEDGKKLSTQPQTWLNTLFNNLTFDPFPFIRKKGKEKLAFVLELIGVDTSDLDEEIDEKYTERHSIGQEISRMGEIVVPDEVAPIDISSVSAQRDAVLKEYETKCDELRKAHAKLEKEAADARVAVEKRSSLIEKANTHAANAKENRKYSLADAKKAEELRRQLAELGDVPSVEEVERQHAEATRLDALAEDVRKEAESLANEVPLVVELLLPPKPDTSQYDEQISNFTALNEEAKAYERALEKKREKEEKSAVYRSLSEEIDALRRQRYERLNQAKMPVDGFEVVMDDPDRPDGLYFNGIHSDNWSGSQAIRISCQMCVALNPKLRAIFIENGSEFDPERLKALDVWARENDIQAIITLVAGGRDDVTPGEYYIEEGELTLVKGE